MGNKNIQMKNFNGVEWDNLYPITHEGNVYDSNSKPLTEKLNEINNDVSELSQQTSSNIDRLDREKVDKQFESIVVNVPSDFPDIQSAIDKMSERKVKQGTLIEINIEMGYEISNPVELKDGDYSHFRITSDSSVVKLSSSFPKQSFMLVRNARAPRIATVINGGGRCTMGIYLRENSSIVVEENCGFTHAGTTNLYVGEGSTAFARNGIFTHGSQDGGGDETGGSGLVAWGGHLFAEGCDVSNSNTYGIQAAHGGVVSFRNGVAKDCGRYGVRSTNGGLMDIRGALIENAGIHGVYLFGASVVNARSVTVRNCGDGGIICLQASNIDARDSLIEGCERNVSVSSASKANLGQATIRNSNGINLSVSRGGLADAWNSTITGAGTSGVYATNGGVAIVVSANVTGSGNRDLYIVDGGEINARSCRTTNSTEDKPVLEDTNALAFNSIENSFGLIWG